jgi:hypothetical protein
MNRGFLTSTKAQPKCLEPIQMLHIGLWSIVLRESTAEKFHPLRAHLDQPCHTHRYIQLQLFVTKAMTYSPTDPCTVHLSTNIIVQQQGLEKLEVPRDSEIKKQPKVLLTPNQPIPALAQVFTLDSRIRSLEEM